MELKQDNIRRRDTSSGKKISNSSYIKSYNADKNINVYLPGMEEVLAYLTTQSNTYTREELSKMNTYTPEGHGESEIFGAGAFIADSLGFAKWVRSLNLPTTNLPSISDSEIEDSADQAFSEYLSGRPDNFVG